MCLVPVAPTTLLNTQVPFGGATMPTPREWVRICELEKAAIEHQSVEKWIEIDRKLDPNWTEEKSKALYQRKEEWLKGCTERLNEARANLRAAEDLGARPKN